MRRHTTVRLIATMAGWAGLALVANGTIAVAQTLQERVDALEKKVGDGSKSVVDDFGIKFHGLIAVDYMYDINAPDSGGPALRVFDNERNSFLLNDANLHIERQSEKGVGFVFDFDFGKTGDVVNNTTFFGRHDSSGAPTTGNGTDFFDARQFYITYKAPIGSGLNLKVGRFVTLAGEEVIKAYNNINFNVSNSILFGFAIPFTHTGIMGTYAVNDQLSLDAGLVNGWDSVSDNNNGKSFHGGIGITPDPHFSSYLSFHYGPEQNDRGGSKRFLTTAVFTVKPIDQLTLIADYNYGNESNVSLTSPGSSNATSTTALYGAPGNAEWQGVAGYIVYSPLDELQLAFRSEVFDDPDGVRTLFQQSGYGPGLTAWEVTPTISYRIVDGLWWRNEYRHDEADKQVFAMGDHFARGQDTVATELIYTF